MLLSIIMPAHNAAAYLERTLALLAQQIAGLEQVEVVAIDDASTDETAKILVEFARTYSWLNLFMLITSDQVVCPIVARHGAMARNTSGHCRAWRPLFSDALNSGRPRISGSGLPKICSRHLQDVNF
ncbi:hypothetical protein CR207_03820 [Chromobacterium violaceum]|nr:hypothetical protein CRN81_03805 [Chromobacterium violaceum]ATP31512.1 hypothetical protein CR207_03820 [Chromobacterium violaceum]